MSIHALQKGGYNPDYKTGHYDGKGRVGEWMKAQPSDTSENGMTWSVVTTGPYMDMLNIVGQVEIFQLGKLNPSVYQLPSSCLVPSIGVKMVQPSSPLPLEKATFP